MSSQRHVPGRPVTDPEGKCPFCLENGLLKGRIIARTDHGFAALVAPDLALVCPTAHLIGDICGTPFAAEYFDLLHQALACLGWLNFNETRNVGNIAGQRLPHIHYKLLERVPGKQSSGFGLDALVKMVDAAPQL